MRVNISITLEVSFDSKGQGTEDSSIGSEIEPIEKSRSLNV